MIKYNVDTEEAVREKAWNLCKEHDIANRLRDKYILQNHVSWNIEIEFGEEAENFYRSDWLAEVDLYMLKYWNL